ncbi:MAG: alpha/beta fold hydrolase [Pirellulales bacterium]|nr:alpha/beta fold hydrolase [Pirellulales bacterium]
MPRGSSFARTLLVLALVGSGCCRNAWHEPRSLKLVQLCAPSAATCEPPDALESARALAARATLADRAKDQTAVDLHYQAAVTAWTALNQLCGTSHDGALASEIYHTSTARFITTAQRHGRLVPGQGVIVNAPGRCLLVPLVPHGFVWQHDDFQALFPIGHYKSEYINRQYRCEGWGVPVVVQRTCPTGCYREEGFLPPGGMFAATALLRPCPTGGVNLELFDPLRAKTHPELPAPRPLASDISAPAALREILNPQLANWLTPFISPTRIRNPGLFMVEPYQPGKIPVIMVHGLASNPLSWLDLANDLRAIPGFCDHFQIWGFRYATGRPFLESAARLRSDLYRALATIDPDGCDPALGHLVLVGHSMGGLICKMQASSSQEILWSAIANRPLEAIATTEMTREQLRQLCFFDPVPNVRRVIFLATPHRGSVWARRPVGRLSSALVRPDDTQRNRHEQLERDNPGVFSPEVSERIPTSVEMLDPDSGVLRAIDSLPLNPCVTFHSVIGYGYYDLREGEGDKVVSIQSANFPCAESQIGVRAKHTQVQRQLETSQEVARILREHLATLESEIAARDDVPDFESASGKNR